MKRCKECQGFHDPGSKLCGLFQQGMRTKSQTPASWPLKSIALAVHRKKIPEAMAKARRHGVPTEFTKGGRPIFTSKEHMLRYCKSKGLVHFGY